MAPQLYVGGHSLIDIPTITRIPPNPHIHLTPLNYSIIISKFQ